MKASNKSHRTHFISCFNKQLKRKLQALSLYINLFFQMQTAHLWGRVSAEKYITVFACTSFNEIWDIGTTYSNTLDFFQIISVKLFLFRLQI